MALSEMEHPLAKDVDTIHTAVSMGFIDSVADQNPNLKLSYFNPLESGSGVGILRIADWEVDDITAIYYPFSVDPGDTTWQVFCEDGLAPVRQRIYTRDLLGRAFNFTVGGKKILSTYVQMDILDDGIVMSVEDGDDKAVAYGGYESEGYETMDRIARRYSSISAVLELAKVA